MILNFFKTKEKRHTIAFYNIENLFDVYNDEFTRDDDMVPNSEKKWSVKRYKNKLRKIGYVISNIGKEEVKRHPAIIGLAEVENEAVLKDLVTSKHLEDYNYKFVHYNSPDERGIDVAFLYDDTVFKVAYSKNYKLELIDDFGVEDLTRDILLVSGLFEGLELHVIVNHWPSRRTGDVETKHKRMKASQKVTAIISELKTKSPNAKVIVMGDFNDDPESESVEALEQSHGLFNPMQTLLSLDRGTTSHNQRWNLFDQFLVTHNFFERKKNTLRYIKADIFDADYLKEREGRYEGSPYRTYVGKKYKGGYSDHFPVYLIVSKK